MSRPSQDTDKKLLRAARAMIAETGISGLSLRAVAARAGVNLGMFHYHFGTKAQFVQRLLQDIYEEFFSRLSLESRSTASPSQRLRAALLVFGRFARDHRRLFVGLLTEVLRGDKNCAQFLKANIPRHIRVVADLIAEGQRRGEFKKIPLPIALAFSLGGMGAPNLVITALEKLKPELPAALSRRGLGAEFLSDAAINLRADLILSGLADNKKRARKP